MTRANDPITVEYGGTKYIFDSSVNMKPLRLYDPSSVGASTATSHDDTDTDYQIATGKVYVVLSLMVQAYPNTTIYERELHTSSTTDTSGTMRCRWRGCGWTLVIGQFQIYDVFSTVNDYVVQSNSWGHANIWGVEMDSEQTPITMSFGGDVIIADAGWTTFTVGRPNYSNTTTYSLHDNTNTDYQVPTGKTTSIKEMTFHAYPNTTSYNGEVGVNTTTDSTTSWTKQDDRTLEGTWDEAFNMRVEIDAAANDYIISAGSWAHPFPCCGIEEDV